MQANSRENNGIVTFFNENQRKDQPNRIFTAAEIYISMGYSVIPVSGKVATIAWKESQNHRPSSNKLLQWFIEDDYTGLAIITGRISQLCVLDFDDLELYNLFKIKHPYLAQTKTVKTRRGYHLYFHIPPHLSLKSSKMPGIDLQYEGRYVVAPPSEGYKTIRGGAPKTLTQQDINIINSFFNSQQTPVTVSSEQNNPNTHTEHYSGNLPGRNNAKSITCGNAPKLDDFIAAFDDNKTPGRVGCNNGGRLSTPLAANDYRTLYKSRINESRQRNSSLFEIGRYIRDDGHDIEFAINTLLDLHIGQKPLMGQGQENLHSRRQEVIKTLNSVYSMPPVRRKFQPRTITGKSSIPYTLREKMLRRRDGTAFLRTLEALIVSRIVAGDILTRQQIFALLAGIVGQHSINKTLYAKDDKDNYLFRRVLPPVSPLANAEIKKDSDTANTSQEEIQTASLSLGKNRTDNYFYKQRAETIHYIMPEIGELCHQLDVVFSNLGVTISLDDVSSAKNYRKRLHFDLILRRPGQYSQDMLGRRVGVTARTIRTYNRELSVKHRKCYTKRFISSENINLVPHKKDCIDMGYNHAGAFLEDDTGKRWPPYREIVYSLWKQRRKVLLCQQEWNYYWIDGVHTPKEETNTVFGLPSEPELVREIPFEIGDYEQVFDIPDYLITDTISNEKSADVFFSEKHDKEDKLLGTPVQYPLLNGSPVKRPISKPEQKPKHQRRGGRGTKPLENPEAEVLAQAIHDNIPKTKVSTARNLITKHGLDVIQPLFRRVMWLHKQGEIGTLKAYFMKSLKNANDGQYKPRTDDIANYQVVMSDAKQEGVAQQIYEAIPQMLLPNTRRLVELYGAEICQNTLGRVLWMHEQGRVSSLAGYFITSARVNWLAKNGDPVNFSIPAPRFKGEQGNTHMKR
jgi:hypothetical protein